jgi:hypothetical protein
MGRSAAFAASTARSVADQSYRDSSGSMSRHRSAICAALKDRALRRVEGPRVLARRFAGAERRACREPRVEEPFLPVPRVEELADELADEGVAQRVTLLEDAGRGRIGLRR